MMRWQWHWLRLPLTIWRTWRTMERQLDAIKHLDALNKRKARR